MNSPYRLWLHALACLLVLGAFILVAVGGSVTSLDAGMAVPDWPGTFGYNMFLAPYEKWGPESEVAGAFWEHSHRLIGSTVGLITIALAVGLWVTQRTRPWLRWLGVGLLGMVIVQGLMGGFRVTENSVFLAAVHGIFGQIVLAAAVVVAAATGTLWSARSATETPAGTGAGWKVLVALLALPVVALVASMLIARGGYSETHREWPVSDVGIVWIAAMTIYMAAAVWGFASSMDRRRGAWTPAEVGGAALLGVLVVQLVLGAAVRHGGAERAITDAPFVFGGIVPPLSAERLATVEPAVLPGVTLGQVWLQYAHRVTALVVCAALAWVVGALSARRMHSRVVGPLTTVIGLTMFQVMLGIWTVWSEINPAMATMHQATGAALLAYTTWLVVRIFLTAGVAEGEPAAASDTATHRLGGEPA